MVLVLKNILVLELYNTVLNIFFIFFQMIHMEDIHFYLLFENYFLGDYL